MKKVGIIQVGNLRSFSTRGTRFDHDCIWVTSRRGAKYLLNVRHIKDLLSFRVKEFEVHKAAVHRHLVPVKGRAFA